MTIYRQILLFLSIVGITSCASRKDNSDKFFFDHFAVNVTNLNRSVDYYQKVFELKEIYDGTHKDNIRWFSLGQHQELHIIEVEDLDLTIPKGVHMALTTRGPLIDFITHLNRLNIDYYDWPGDKYAKSTRPDGVYQVYIQDPDGYWIEINDGLKRYDKKGHY